jgi:hypothetical protein
MTVRQGMLRELELLKKKPEARYDESETHQGQASANACQKSSLGSQIIAQAGCPTRTCP